ncbi:MAG: hypothetical protein MJB57_03425 [Gemmatimonadetes bacterium]|nr:hypothetical protein [Gemmatimonadota bacterium]
MLEIAGSAVVAFTLGWLLRGSRGRSAFRAQQDRWQRQVDELQGRLALERLRIDNFIRDHELEVEEEAPKLELHRDPKLARPRGRGSDSSAARA